MASNIFIRTLNGLSNIVSGVGTDAAKSSHNTWTPETQDDGDLWELYSGSWLASSGVDTPVEDALKAFRKTPEGLDFEVDSLYNAKAILETALKYERIFGGSAIVGWFNTNSEGALGSNDELLFLQVLKKGDMQWNDSDIVQDNRSPLFGLPEYMTVSTNKGQKRIHLSRMLLFPMNSRFKSKKEFFPNSILHKARRDVLSAHASLAMQEDILSEVRVDTFQVPNLMTRCADDETTEVMLKRFAINAQVRSQYHHQLIDTDEKYIPSSTNVSGVPQMVVSKLNTVAATFRIPVTKFLGTSPDGMNATGESDSRDYYQSVDRIVENRLVPFVNWLDKLTGFTGEWSLSSVRVVAPKEQAEIDNKVVTTAKELESLTTPEIAARYILETSSVSATEDEADALLGDILGTGQ